MTENAEKVESQTMGEILAARPTLQNIAARKVEAKTSTTESETQAETKVDAKETVKAAETEEKTEEKKVPLKALHESRQELRETRLKLKQAEERLAQLETKPTETTYYNEGVAAKADDPLSKEIEKLKNDRLVSTINQVRRERKDADEIFTKFDQICDEFNVQREGSDLELYSAMINSPDPGHFIVEYVDRHETTKKYGTDPAEMAKKIRADLEKEVTESVTAKLRNKTNSKASLPADFAGSRAGSGADSPWSPPTADSLYNRRRRLMKKG